MWLGRAAISNPVRAKALEWTIAGHGAIGYLLWKNSNDTQAASATPAVATITIVPDTTAKRDNPDPKVFDDATVRNPTPKPTFTQSSLFQPVFANVKADDLVYASMDTPQVYYANSPLNTNISKTTYLTPSNKVNPGSPYTQYMNWTLTSGAKSGQNFIIYSKQEWVPYQCPTGYTLTNGTCNLTNAEQVTKPAGKVPCEVIRNADGSWDVDSKNPECGNVAAQLSTSGRNIKYTRGVGDYDSVTTQDDGSLAIDTITVNGNRSIKTQPYSPSAGGYPIGSITDNGPGGTGTTAGTGTTTGTTGTGTGSCGGTGQVKCGIDDSGFDGKAATINTKADAAIAKFDDRVAQIEAVNGNNTFGIDKSWIPDFKPGGAITCQPLKWSPSISHGPLSGWSTSADINWCDKIDFLREYFAWLVGFLTTIAIAFLFFNSNGTAKGK